MNLATKYRQEIAPKLLADLKLTNLYQVPKVDKVIINAGLGKYRQHDAKIIDVGVDVLTKISGQKPVITLAKKSVAAFKVREGMPVGVKVTLRGLRMYDFIAKLVHVTFPRVRDFRGIPLKAIDSAGHLNLGFADYLPFPEISSDDVEKLHGLQVVVHTITPSREASLQLFRELGFPLRKK